MIYCVSTEQLQKKSIDLSINSILCTAFVTFLNIYKTISKPSTLLLMHSGDSAVYTFKLIFVNVIR